MILLFDPVEVGIAAGDHLVLADVGDDDGVAAGELVEVVDDFAHGQFAVGGVELVLDNGVDFLLVEVFKALQPFGMGLFLDLFRLAGAGFPCSRPRRVRLS